MAKQMHGENGRAADPAVLIRRAKILDDHGKRLIDDDAPVVGLALSGGGIRSATFSLGLLRALAKNQVLHRIDYLSTVSGGGYIGAMLGRLYHADSKEQDAPEKTWSNALEVEEGLNKDDSLLLWWLRNNGRYLLPSGAWDTTLVFAGQVRSFLATQFEVMVVSLFLAWLVALPHVAYAALSSFFEIQRTGVSLWWWLLPAPGAAALTACYAFWMLDLDERTRVGISALALLVGGLLLYLGFIAPPQWTDEMRRPAQLASLLILPVIPGGICAHLGLGDKGTVESRRIYWTRFLAKCFIAAVALFLIGGLDMSGWLLRDEVISLLRGQDRVKVSLGIGWTALLIVIARTIAPYLSARDRLAAAGLPLESIANLLGIALTAAIAVFWTGIFQLIMLPSQEGQAPGALQVYGPFMGALTAGLLIAFFTGRELQQLNRSSLHYFYRSRLARTYVSVGNFAKAAKAGHDGARFPVSPLAACSPRRIEGIRRVTDQLPDDDPLFQTYRPHEHGGPVHLINCCINQTRDDRTGLFNADRKGVGLTLGPLGVETGTQDPEPPFEESLKEATLAQWVAISGAAVATGMGSHTKPGIAVMTFLSGFRLGYWNASLIKGDHRGWWLVTKYVALLREMFAVFPGLNAPYWYVSDGGHFDNTGVYPLLKRKLPIIILADCGADPDYTFGDVENLIRKARIDYETSIEFLDPDASGADAIPIAHLLGTPASINPGNGDKYLLLARVTYPPDITPEGPIQRSGALLIVKPRVTAGLDLDTSNYADRNPTFPQQGTINQFYSEQEWEAYCTLGLALGAPIDTNVLYKLEKWAHMAVVTKAPATPAVPGPMAEITKKRHKVAKSIGTSLGAGVIITSLIAGWQAWNTARNQQDRVESSFESRLFDVDSAISGKDSYSDEIHSRMENLVAFTELHPPSAKQLNLIRERVARIDNLCKQSKDQASMDLCNNRTFDLADYLPRQGGFVSDSLAKYANWPYATAVNTATSPGSASSAARTSGAAATPTPSPGNPAYVAPSAPTSSASMSRADLTLAPAPVLPAPPPGGAASGAPVASGSVGLLSSPGNQSPKPVQASPTPSTGGGKINAPGTIANVGNQCRPVNGRRFTLYTQIYSEATRGTAQLLLSDARTLGVVIPGIENVTASAEHRGDTPPPQVNHPTLVYSIDGQACAESLKTLLSGRGIKIRTVPLPSSIAGEPTTIELWIPSTTTISSADGQNNEKTAENAKPAN